MPVVQVEAQLSANTLLEAVDQLSLPELEQFVAQFLALRARRRAPALSQTESELLTKINKGLPSDAQSRLSTLVNKRQDETLSPEEHSELLHLTEQLERAEAARAEALAQLATLHGVSLATLMQELGISAPEYA